MIRGALHRAAAVLPATPVSLSRSGATGGAEALHRELQSCKVYISEGRDTAVIDSLKVSCLLLATAPSSV